MNKQDLVKTVELVASTTKQAAEEVVDAVLDAIETALMRGEDVKITGFGTFKRVETKARTCRNPHTGEAIEVPAGHKVKFKASSKLKG